MSETVKYHFEKHRKTFCEKLAYFLRNPKLSNSQRKDFLDKLEALLHEIESEVEE